ncbi:MAG TPA: hypothetical protein VMM12_15155 [Longimicrobiales bacterium]|nr:hypothetical protein [Longimicrobiales bacterium]
MGSHGSLVDFGLAPREANEEIRDLQNQLIALLITMIRNLEARARPHPPRTRRR